MNATLDRLDRVLAMVPWLLANPGAPIREVAERFGTDPASIADDLDVLGYCGVPGYGGGDLIEVSVVADRVHVRMADFFRRPLRLGLGEATTLLLAGRALLAAPALADTDALRRAVARLEEAMGAAEVAVELPSPDEVLARAREGIDQQRVLRLRYRAGGDEQERTRSVEPLALVAAGGHWYLRAHCRDAGGVRDFRADRIREVEVTDDVVAEERRADVAARAAAPRYVPAEGDPEVALELDAAAAWLVDAVAGARRDAEGAVRFRVRSLEWAARLVLGLAGAARVLEPPELAERVAELAGAARARYGDAGQDEGADGDEGAPGR